MTPSIATSAGERLDSATRELLTGSLRELFATATGAAEVAAALADMGWDEVRADDPAGATTLLFTEHGRALATSRLLDDVLLAELTLVLPEPTGPRAVLHPDPAEGPLPAGAPLRGLLLAPLDGVAEVVVPVADGASRGSRSLYVVPARRLAGATAPVGGFDPSARRLAVAAAPVPDTAAVPADDAWTRAEAAGRRALAAEIAGVCEAALAIATAHTSARVQYGRPIGSFQAVRHRLAEAHVAITAGRTVLDAAWAAAGSADGGAWAARVAKLRAGRAQAEVMRHTVQVLGAMGLTLESEMHRHVARAAALDALLGDHRSLAETTGAELLDGADADPVVEI